MRKFVKWSKEKLLLNEEQVNAMDTGEIVRYIRDNPDSWIKRNEDGTINRIVRITPIFKESGPYDL